MITSKQRNNFWLLMGSFLCIGAGQLLSLDFELHRLGVIGFFLAIVLLLIAQQSSKNEIRSVIKESLFFVPFYFYLIISSSWSVIPGESLRNALYVTIDILPAFLFGVLLMRRYDFHDITMGFVLFISLVFIQALYNYYQTGYLMGMTVGSHFIMRTITGSIIIFLIPIMLGMYLYARNVLFLTGFIILLFFLLTINSRSALIISIPAMFWVLYVYHKKLALKSLVVVICAVLLASPFVKMKPFERLMTTNLGISDLLEGKITHIKGKDGTRRLINFVSIQLIKEKPLLGGGYSAVWQINKRDYGEDLSAHGFIPGTFAEVGLAGASLFLLIIFRVMYKYRELLKSVKEKTDLLVIKSFFISFISVLLYGLFHQLIETVYFALIIGIFLGSSRNIPITKPERLNIYS